MAAPAFESFPLSNSTNWSEAAKKELGGKDPFESLIVNKHGLIIKPYYDAANTSSIADFQLSPSVDPVFGPRGWRNTPHLTVDNEQIANENALDHLNNGADGIIFSIPESFDVAKLLNNIELPYCSTYFIVNDGIHDFFSSFINFVNAKGFDKTQIVGGLFWPSLPKNQSDLLRDFQGWDKFHILGQMIPDKVNPADEIVEALIRGVNIASQENDVNFTFQQMMFAFEVGTDFFLEIAKLKAFRRLWHQVIMAYGITDKLTVPIHGKSSCWNNEKYEPNANMLKATTAAISCILGGCDLITIESDSTDNSFKSRIARNALTILKEESHLNQPADATAGSYYLENLIDQLAKESWSQFQAAVSR